ncbi:hypothetical protein J6TS7_37510 [Paenibacillus dendritiformis]|nr:hypothetical protein J6TS7_37510 [Paenibacillus dendritiformis]
MRPKRYLTLSASRASGSASSPVALSLTGIVVLVARTANLIQAPFTANFIDYANHHPEFDPLPYLRFTLVAASAGTLLAIAVFPTFIHCSRGLSLVWRWQARSRSCWPGLRSDS